MLKLQYEVKLHLLTGSAFGLSILLIATTKSTALSSFFNSSITSCVCGITPSSAATTNTTMSVTLAPRARIAEKAACPGVSKKVINRGAVEVVFSLATGTENAPMCWVIPPASPFATEADRKVSNNVVFPWST